MIELLETLRFTVFLKGSLSILFWMGNRQNILSVIRVEK
jgi:hypothetical protein